MRSFIGAEVNSISIDELFISCDDDQIRYSHWHLSCCSYVVFGCKASVIYSISCSLRLTPYSVEQIVLTDLQCGSALIEVLFSSQWARSDTVSIEMDV